MMIKMLGRACVSLLLITATATAVAQQRDQDPRQGRNERSMPSDPRSQRQDAERSPRDSRSQPEGTRQGRLSPEERQALRRQIDEAGHDIYRSRR